MASTARMSREGRYLRLTGHRAAVDMSDRWWRTRSEMAVPWKRSPVTWHLPQPILTTPTTDPALPPSWAAEPKWDGYRAQLARYADGRVLLRSRRGVAMPPSFPEIRAAAAQLPGDTGLDGELVVWEEGRLTFERLQQRLPRRGSPAVAAAARWPAHFVVFDVLRLAGTDTTAWSYQRRRTAIEELFTDLHLQSPWTLNPRPPTPASPTDGWTGRPPALKGCASNGSPSPTGPPPEPGASTKSAPHTTPSSAPSPAHSAHRAPSCSDATTPPASSSTSVAPPPSPRPPPAPWPPTSPPPTPRTQGTDGRSPPGGAARKR
ncbi:hypothetical protein [Streptomyces cacaoi]|uniref:ATP-dependent DNA ligase n=1 Tax=Streptomyces cacaoi TaxID=1898 RepID=UPI003749CF3A